MKISTTCTVFAESEMLWWLGKAAARFWSIYTRRLGS